MRNLKTAILAAGLLAGVVAGPAQGQAITRAQGGNTMTVGSGGQLVVGPGILRWVKTDTEPTSPAEGWSYWDDSENILKLYTGAAWVAVATAGGGTLDQAYDYGGAGAGKAITADNGAVAISSTAADNNGVLTLTKNPVGAQSGDGLVITMGAQCTGAALTLANTGSGNDLTGSGTPAAWSITKAGAATFGALTCTSLTNSGAMYQAAIAAAAAGNENLTVDAAGNGTITIGGTSTGNTIFPGVVAFNGNTTFGNAATDTVTVTGSVAANVTLDDGTTDSPSLIFKDATDTTTTLAQVDNTALRITPSAATAGLQVYTGNLWVGNGSPGTAAMDGEDFYVNGDSEFDGAVQLDGTVTAAGTLAATTLTVATLLDVNEDIDVDFDANDEEVDIATSAGTYAADAAVVSIKATAAGGQANNTYLLRLRHTADGDAQDNFVVCEDNNGDDMFAVNTGGDLDVNGNIVGDGGGQMYGMLRTVTVDADARTITTAEAQTVIVNTGQAGAGVKALPEASTAHGVQITFVVTTGGQNFDINPDDADQILGLTDAAGDAIRCSTAGSTVTLLCVDDTNWVVVSSYGTWADAN